MNIAIIDDHPEHAKSLQEVLLEDFPEARVEIFESVYESLDFPATHAIIDLSALAPASMFGHEHCYAPIASYLERRPGVSVLVTSAWPVMNFAHIMGDVKQVFPDAHIAVDILGNESDWIRETS